MKKMLLMGGTNSAYEIKEYAEKNNIILCATGIYPDTLLKKISEYSYDVDAIDVDAVVQLVKNEGIDAIFTGCNEDVVPKAIESAIKLEMPHYCDLTQWELCMNKAKFKELCAKFGIPVAKRYLPDEIKSIDFPIVVKPADSCGSQGFSICNSGDEVSNAIENAKSFSRTGTVIIEDLMPYDAVIIHYTAINGELFFSGMSDKKSGFIGEKKSSVMAFQSFPSAFTNKYLDKINKKAIKMFKSIGIHDGAIWIEAFNNNGEFYFNEMGLRFGGSMTYLPVKYYYGVNQLDLMIEYCINGKITSNPEVKLNPNTKNYCILPIHVRSGTIASVAGEKEIMNRSDVYAYVPIHEAGDVIKSTGTISQVFCYMHILYSSEDELMESIKSILNQLKAFDSDGNNMLFTILNFG